MAGTYTWIGPTGGDWFTATNWSPAGPPPAGSQVLIGTDTGPMVGPADPPLDDLGVNLTADGAHISADQATFAAAFLLVDSASDSSTALHTDESSTFDGQAGFAAGTQGSYLNMDVASGQTLTIGSTGTLTAALSNSIIFYADGAQVTNDGTLDAAGGLISVYQGTLDGTGSILVGQGGQFFSNTDVGAGQSITFLDPNGSVEFNGATFDGTISNLQAGDEIIVGGVLADDVSYDFEHRCPDGHQRGHHRRHVQRADQRSRELRHAVRH